MTQRKSPGSGNNQGEDGKKEVIGMDVPYPFPAATVNRNCRSCQYHHGPATPRRAAFCQFTGEPITTASAEAACGFFIPGGGHAEF